MLTGIRLTELRPLRRSSGGTAFVHHAELTGISTDSTIRERLTASITAADRRTAQAKATLAATLADLQNRGEHSLGRLGVAEAAVGRSATLVEAADASL